MTMLDALRAKAQVALKLKVHVDDIYRLVFGNHSPTMFPDLENALLDGEIIYKKINDHDWVEQEFLPKIQQRGAEIIQSRGASSASSAARAACETVSSVENPTRSGEFLMLQYLVMVHTELLKESFLDSLLHQMVWEILIL